MSNLLNNSEEYRDVYINDIRDDINNSNFPEYKEILNYSNCNARIYQNLTVTGDLNLDEGIENICVLIIEGNLEVEGNIYNKDGVYLYVKGKTTAKNMITGDPIVSLNIVEIKNFLVCWGNDGVLSGNSLKTKIFVNHDLCVEFQKMNSFLSYDPEGNGDAEYLLDLADFEEYLIKEKHNNLLSTYEKSNILYLNIDKQIKMNKDAELSEVMIISAQKA